MKRFAVFVFLVAALTMSRPLSAQAQAQELRVAIQPGILFLQLWMMKHENTIEKQAALAGMPNLKVSWSNLSSGGANVDALLSGNVDIVTGGITNLLIVWAKSKGQIKGIAAVSGVPFKLVTRDPNVKTLKDFSDKNRIAVPTVKMSIQAVVLAMAVEKAFGEGNANRFDPYMVQLGHAQSVISVLDPRNQVDSHFSSPPFMQMELKDSNVKSVLNSVDVTGPSTTLLAYTSEKFYNANPKLIEIFVNALNETNDIINKDPKKAGSIYLESTKEKFTVDELAEMITERGSVFNTVPSGTMQFADFMSKVGLIDRKPASWKDYFFTNIQSKNGS